MKNQTFIRLFLSIIFISLFANTVTALHSSEVKGVTRAALGTLIKKGSQYGNQGAFALLNSDFYRTSNEFLHTSNAHFRLNNTSSTSSYIPPRAGNSRAISGPRPKNKIQFKVVSNQPTFSDVSKSFSPKAVKRTVNDNRISQSSKSFKSISI